MRFTMSVEMDNAAFSDGNAGAELSRIVRLVSERVAPFFAMDGRLWDSNGNRVGTWEIEGAPDDDA